MCQTRAVNAVFMIMVGSIVHQSFHLMRDTVLAEVTAETTSDGALAGRWIIVMDEDKLFHVCFGRYIYYVNYN